MCLCHLYLAYCCFISTCLSVSLSGSCHKREREISLAPHLPVNQPTSIVFLYHIITGGEKQNEEVPSRSYSSGSWYNRHLSKSHTQAVHCVIRCSCSLPDVNIFYTLCNYKPYHIVSRYLRPIIQGSLYLSPRVCWVRRISPYFDMWEVVAWWSEHSLLWAEEKPKSKTEILTDITWPQIVLRGSHPKVTSVVDKLWIKVIETLRIFNAVQKKQKGLFLLLFLGYWYIYKSKITLDVWGG